MECHEHWLKLIKQEVPSKTDAYDIKVVNTQVSESPYKISSEDDVYKSIPVVFFSI